MSDEHFDYLCSMGFDPVSAREALAASNNNLDNAVSILTGDMPVSSSYDTGTLCDLDFEMKDIGGSGGGGYVSSRSSNTPVYGPSLPPSYEELARDSSQDTIIVSSQPSEVSDEKQDEPLEFPVAHLYELENRVFTESWSIPYKREESLGRCLLAAIRLAKDGLCDTDIHCRQFFNKCLPEAFSKLLTSSAVHRWAADIQEGIFDMLQLYVDLVAARLKHEPIPCDLLLTLAQVFNLNSEYSSKNKSRQSDRFSHWNQIFNGSPYAVVQYTYRFAEKEGFELIKARLEGGTADAPALAALLAPFGDCAEVLNPEVVKPILKDGIEAAINFASNLSDEAIKEKKVGSICEMLCRAKLICLTLWPDEVERIDSLRLEIVLKMLSSPHFNAKMNALKEVNSFNPNYALERRTHSVTRLIDDCTAMQCVRSAIDREAVLDWLVQRKVLSIALEGNIDQVQYCDKIKNIVDFLGAKLSVDELAKIWSLQVGETGVIIDNIHSIIAAAAVKFNQAQLESLVILVNKSWSEDNDVVKEKLLRLIGSIGRDTKNMKITQNVLELLWDLAHLPSLKSTLTQLALSEHHTILNDSFSVREALRKSYATKCADDIREARWVIPAMKQLQLITKSIAKNSFQKAEKLVLQELSKSHDIIKLVTTSLNKFHEEFVASEQSSGLRGSSRSLSPTAEGCEGGISPIPGSSTSPLIQNSSSSLRNSAGSYNRKEVVTVHLSVLQFILFDGGLTLPWHRALDIWSTLASNPNALDWEREACFEWFSECLQDLEQDAYMKLFQQELLKLEPGRLTEKAFSCFKVYFKIVNQNENRLQKSGNSFIIEKPDLIGLDFLWKICLNSQDHEIAESAINLLLDVSYLNLAPKHKRDPSSLHKKFIDECNNWLELAMQPIEESLVANSLKDVTKLLTVPALQHGLTLPLTLRSSVNMLNIERLLLIAERYIVSVEELHHPTRSIPPHGASFQGQPLTILVTAEPPHRQEFMLQVHTNESVGSVRQKVARKMNFSPDQIQFFPSEKVSNKDHKLLNQLGWDDGEPISLNVKVVTGGLTSSSSSVGISSYPPAPSSTVASATQDYSSRRSIELEEERMLPGVIMSNGGQVFQMLYHLATLDQPKITSRARSLLRLVPTDPSVVAAFDSIGRKGSYGASAADSAPVPPSSPALGSRKPTSSSNLTATSSTTTLSSRQTTPPLEKRGSPVSTLKRTLSNRIVMSGSSGSLNKNPEQSRVGMVKTTPTETIEGLLGTASADMSLFRVLYNLEVLSSRLMPVTGDMTLRRSAQKFCEDYLSAGGLSLIIDVLRRDVQHTEVDYETRQGCYSITLQLLKCLLCGEDVTGEAQSSQVSEVGRRASLGEVGDGGAAASGGSAPPSLEFTGPPPGVKAIQMMDVTEFTDLVSCLIRVSWAATAGRLQLVGSQLPIKTDTTPINSPCSGSNVRELSIGSTGSATSSCSEGDVTCLHAGVCVKQKTVSAKDVYIASEALELLVTCLQLRTNLISVFYTIPCVGDFITEVLVGASQEQIRDKAMQQFVRLSDTTYPISSSSSNNTEDGPQTPLQFVLRTLLKARLPFWVPSSYTRGTSYRMLRNCKQFFQLKSRLIARLTSTEAKQLQLNIGQMLKGEIDWLCNFVPSEDGATPRRDIDNSLLAGHLLLIKTLIATGAVDKVEIGKNLIGELLHEFLFPASKLIHDALSNSDNGMASFQPKCSSSESRVAAYAVLCELAHGCVENLRMISKELISMHHQSNPELAGEWEYMPPVASRSTAGFVGLRNGGATCYMNSVIQQLYMTPGLSEQLLALDVENVDEESVLYQIQQVLGHLQESKLQYYVPEKFWQVFKLWGSAVRVQEQQDALDFFQALIDQLDEQTKKLGKDPICKKSFQGLYSDQKICRDCNHRYEQEEAFFSLSVTVKNATLQDSLDQFVKGELLEGENAYFCEKCGIKRSAVKRTCIKSLPPVLCIQLKRFDFDWESNRAIKFDDLFKFPLVLDMEPYTAEGMAWREAASEGKGGELGEGDGREGTEDTEDLLQVNENKMDITPPSPRKGQGLLITTNQMVTTAVNARHINYELVGVVVHSGQANAGHYYSYIKDRRGNYMNNPTKGRWYKFNDTVVEEFEMTDSALETECFGGKYRAKVFDGVSSSSSNNQEERLRYWNGYLLFYERCEEVRTPVSAKKSKITTWKVPTAIERASGGGGIRDRQDSLKQLTELVHKGERRGLFGSRMPVRVQQVVREENLRFIKNRNIYDSDYFNFVRDLAGRNLRLTEDTEYTDLCVESLNLSAKFLFNTYFRTKTQLRGDHNDWINLITSLILQSKETCNWMIEYFSSVDSGCVKSLLLECPTKDVRSAFGTILEKTMMSFFKHAGIPTQKNFDDIVERLLGMLSRDVPDNCKQSLQYFNVFSSYTQMGLKACSHMFGRNAFCRLVEFLVGSINPVDPSAVPDLDPVRRWSSLQAREFGPLHVTLANLILHCDVSPFMTEDKSVNRTVYRQQKIVIPQHLLKMSADMQRLVFSNDSVKYINEVVLSLRELNSIEHILVIQDALLYCSCYNLPFTTTIIRSILHKCLTVPSNELKFLFQVLQQLLQLEDNLQFTRVKLVIDGVTEDGKVDGMLVAVRQNHTSDSRRSYQIIKFLVNLSSRCPLAKDYLLQATTRWNWAVNWLKTKMNDACWGVQAHTSNEDSNSASFQRTISAQDTLAEATALLTEFEAQEQQQQQQRQADMDISSSRDGDDDDNDDDEGEPEVRPGGGGGVKSELEKRVKFTSGEDETVEDTGL